jgi:transcriptional regulator with XRE-family HTH domain
MDFKKIIGNNIFMLRQKYGLTQQEFVDRLNIGFSRGHLSNIENGQNMPSAEFIRIVSDSFNVDTNWLLSTHVKDYPDLVIEDDEKEFLLSYRALPDEAKMSIQSLMNLINNANT